MRKIKWVSRAISKDKTRKNITVAKVEFNTLIATNGHVLFVAGDMPLKDGYYINVKDELIPVESEGTFPDYRRVIPQDWGTWGHLTCNSGSSVDCTGYQIAQNGPWIAHDLLNLVLKPTDKTIDTFTVYFKDKNSPVVFQYTLDCFAIVMPIRQ